MPTTYTHDLFGKTVYQKVDKELQDMIRAHKTVYIIGLHGPDILFYVRPFHRNRINEIGYRMHREEAAGFFERGAQLYRETEDEAVLSYLCGFVCHFMLDSTCHPYIAQYMEKTGAGHDEIETELDRAMMEATGHNPFFYHPSHVLHATGEAARTVALVLGNISEKEVRHMLHAMKFYTDLTVCPTNLKRKLLLGAAKVFGAYRLVQGRIIRRQPLPVCGESTETLKHLFHLAVPETVTVMEEYYRAAKSGEEIGSRFYRNYN